MISFFAKVQASNDDPKFGFGSRLTKLEVIDESAVADRLPDRPEREETEAVEYDYAADDRNFDAQRERR